MNYTSIEQSKKLLELGLKAETADACYDVGYSQTKAHIECENFISYFTNDEFPELKDRYIPCWSVGTLIELMPEFVSDEDGQYYLKILKSYYHGIGIRYGNDFRIKASFVGENAFYEMICWLLQNNYIKTE